MRLPRHRFAWHGVAWRSMVWCGLLACWHPSCPCSTPPIQPQALPQPLMDSCQNYVAAYALPQQLSPLLIEIWARNSPRPRVPAGLLCPATPPPCVLPLSATSQCGAIELINFHVDISICCIFNERVSPQLASPGVASALHIHACANMFASACACVCECVCPFLHVFYSPRPHALASLVVCPSAASSTFVVDSFFKILWQS